MSDAISERQTNGRRYLYLVAPAILLILALLALTWPNLGSANRPLKPLPLAATPETIAVSGQPQLITFIELNEDPFAFRNQLIRVTGDYTPLDPPGCTPYSGPRFRWALINDQLQMDAVGYEAILRLAPANLTLTVDGVWRLYQGPAGCGKEPQSENVWYLEVMRIVQPNPLPNFDRPRTNTTIVGDEAITGGDEAGTVTLTPSPTSTTAVTPTLLPITTTNTATPSPTATANNNGVTPTTAVTTPTATHTRTATPTRTPTTDPLSTPTVTPTPSPTPTITPTRGGGDPQPTVPSASTSTPVPPAPTSNPGPYPTSDAYP